MEQIPSNFAPRKNTTLKTRKAMEKTNTPAKTQVYNLVILDKSGSMECICKEAVNGYNETLGTIKAAHCCAIAPVADRKKMRKQFSEEYYDKDKK